MLPTEDTAVRRDDRLLFCGSSTARSRMEWNLLNDHALDYVLTGEVRVEGWIWRMLQRNTATAGDE